VEEEEQHVGGRERQQKKDPRRRIEDAGLGIREPRLTRRVVRIPKRQPPRAQLLRGEVAKRLEIVEVIAESEDLLLDQRRKEEGESEEGDEGEGEAVALKPRTQNAERRT